MENFERGELIADGRYGVVYKATDKTTGRVVTIKEFSRAGHQFGMREWTVTQQIPPTPLVARVISHYWMQNKNILCLVYENQDLPTRRSIRYHMDEVIELTIAQIQLTMFNLLTAVHHCHLNHVIHRGLNSDNVLFEVEPIRVLLSDFRSAKVLPLLASVVNYSDSDSDEETGGVFTPPSEIFKTYHNFSAPELLMGARVYGTSVDIWSAGCIFAHLVNGTTLFRRAQRENEQLRSIFEVVGLPSAQEKLRLPDIQWEQFSDLEYARRPLTEFVPRLSPAGVDLLSQMLEIVPERRISALDALSHAFFGGFLNLEE